MSANKIEPGAGARKHYAGIKLLSILAGGLFLLLVAVMLVPSVLNVDYMFTMGSVLVVLPLASLAIALMWSRGIAAERLTVDPVVEGESKDVRLILRQRFPTSLMVEVDDSLPRSLTSEPAMPVAMHVQGVGCELSYALRPNKRGVFKIGPIKLRIYDPLGVISLVRRFDTESEVVVYPKPLPLEPWTLVAGAGSAGLIGDVLAKPMAGASAEFYGARKYYPGDDLRRVHWKSAARARELVVKEFLDDARTNDTIIALDTEIGTDVSDGTESSLDYAVRVAAYVAERVLSLGGKVSLATAATSGTFSARAATIRDLPSVLDRLARTNADSAAPVAEVLSQLDSHIQHRMGLVIITSKVDERLRSVVGRLLSRGAVIGQVYVDPSSFRADYDNQPAQTDVQFLLDPRIPCWKIERGGPS